jgi:hypothetical protein
MLVVAPNGAILVRMASSMTGTFFGAAFGVAIPLYAVRMSGYELRWGKTDVKPNPLDGGSSLAEHESLQEDIEIDSRDEPLDTD